jgi:hypothetical protein
MRPSSPCKANKTDFIRQTVPLKSTKKQEKINNTTIRCSYDWALIVLDETTP